MFGRLRSALKRPILAALARRDDRARRHLQPKGTLPLGLWDLGSSRDGHLTVQGCDTRELARRFGTPLQVVDHARLAKSYHSFLESFRRHWPRVEVSYSYKTNPLPGVLAALHELGAGAEVISAFELWLALALGVPPERIIFNGPAKTEESLALAVARGIDLVNVDGFGEIETLARLVRGRSHRQRVAVRVVTSVGWASQFGFALGDGAALAAFERLRACEGLDACGLHVHLGTGIRNVPIYVQAVRELIEFAATLRQRLGVEIQVFDLGGGFGVPTVREYTEVDQALVALGHGPRRLDPDAPPRIEAYGRAVTELFRARYGDRDEGRMPRLVFEPGRAVTSSAQLLLLRALAVKPGPRGSRNVILDGGKNVAIPLGYELHEILPASRLDEPAEGPANLYGPLCHPSDLLLARKPLPRVEPGDLFAVMDAGAYFVPNQMNFSNPRPAVVMVRDGVPHPIRERESFEDVVALDDPALFGLAAEAGPEAARQASEQASRLVQEG